MERGSVRPGRAVLQHLLAVGICWQWGSAGSCPHVEKKTLLSSTAEKIKQEKMFSVEAFSFCTGKTVTEVHPKSKLNCK